MAARVGLMGGTFNPIHLGHLVVAAEAQAAFTLDEILFIPNQIPPHRRNKPDLADAQDRYVMVCLAIAGNPGFRPSRIEIDASEVSYTVHTVERLQEQNPDVRYSFITGADSLSKDAWYGLDRLLGMVERFIVATRTGYPMERLHEKVRSFGLEHEDRVVPLPIPNVDVSSTEVRERIRGGHTIRYLVPWGVEDYIRKMGLYR
ncbi:MAG: nicotinate-nucleotide adenylyltransferase [Candidatus Xenobia bacterium]